MYFVSLQSYFSSSWLCCVNRWIHFLINLFRFTDCVKEKQEKKRIPNNFLNEWILSNWQCHVNEYLFSSSLSYEYLPTRKKDSSIFLLTCFINVWHAINVFWIRSFRYYIFHDAKNNLYWNLTITPPPLPSHCMLKRRYTKRTK